MITTEEIMNSGVAMRVSKKKINTLRYVFNAMLHDLEYLEPRGSKFTKLWIRAKDICIEMGNETEKYCELKMYESA